MYSVLPDLAFNSSISISLVVVALVGSFWLSISRIREAIRTRHIPGPWHTSWTKAVYNYHFLAGTRCEYVHALHTKYGPAVRIGPSHVNFMNTEAYKTINGSRESFRKSPFYRLLAVENQQGLFNTVDVEFHRRHRRLLAGPMAESSLLQTVLPVIEARIALVISRIREEVASRGAADVLKWWLFMATDIIGELSFGESFRMLELGHANELEQGSLVGALRATLPPFIMKVSSLIPLPFTNRAHEAGERMTQYAVVSLDRYRKLVDKGADADMPQTLFYKVFKASGEGTMPYNEIRDEALNYIAAGSDTVSITLTYLTWELSRKPKIRKRLVEELRTLPADFGAQELRELQFLNQVIDETLRLYCAAPPPFPRLVPSDGAYLAGYYLPGGIEVSAQAFSMHRDTTVFPSPEEFRPERWQSPTTAMKDSLVPFGRGARVCIGQHLARIELRLATARFFLAFPSTCMSSLEGMTDDDMKPVIQLFLTSKGKRCLLEAK
ncbi:cytochrome protein [Xylariaceae sp. FL1272]|nr:cytochrome protein [Xylariaceae sp. FL1272]